jgi:hypothetical protein
VRWMKVKGHQKSQGPHKTGNDRADELAVFAKKESGGLQRGGSASQVSARSRDLPRKSSGNIEQPDG